MRGTIRQRGEGRWQLQVYAAGRRWAKTIRGSRRDAEDALPGFILEVRERTLDGAPDEMTVAQLCDRWIGARSADWSPKTTLERRRQIDTYIRPRIGHLRIDQLTATHLDALYGQLRAAGGRGGAPLSAATVHKAHSILHAALAQAVRWRILRWNPADAATPPSVPASNIDPPGPAQVARILAHLADTDPDFTTLLRLAALTGARRGELAALRWPDLADDQVTIARAIVDGGPGVGLVEKARKAGRPHVVALDPGTVELLAAHRRRVAERALAAGVPLARDAFVFSADPAGRRPRRPDHLTRRFTQLRDELGLDGVRLHDLRHAVATQLLAAGVDIRTVAGRLGHANPSMTLKTYAHFMPAADRDAAERLARIIDAG